MEENSKEKGKIEEENDEDNIGRDQYFSMERDIDSNDSDMDDEHSKYSIPNITNYLNNTNYEIQDNVEIPQINPDKTFINDKIEENINMKENISNGSKNIKSFNNNTIINNININSNTVNINNNNGKKYFEDQIQFTKSNNINLQLNNNINNPDLKHGKSPEKIYLSSSGEEEDEIKEITGDQFKRHFQEDKFGEQRKIEVIDPDKNRNILHRNNYKEILKKNNQKTHANEDKIFNCFFMDKNSHNNKPGEIQMKNNINNNKVNLIQNKNKFNHKNNSKLKEFIPINKANYKNNSHYQKLLINRVEHQILTDIYNTYENKDEFNTTYYYITKLKEKMTNESVEKAIKFLDDIEPLDLRQRIAIESTYFFKEVVREEVENAKANNGELILIKQPEDRYMQSIMNLSGQINHGNNFKRKGKSNMRYNHANYMMNNFNKNSHNNNMGNNLEFNKNKINTINANPYVFQGQKLFNQNNRKNNLYEQ